MSLFWLHSFGILDSRILRSEIFCRTNFRMSPNRKKTRNFFIHIQRIGIERWLESPVTFKIFGVCRKFYERKAAIKSTLKVYRFLDIPFCSMSFFSLVLSCLIHMILPFFTWIQYDFTVAWNESAWMGERDGRKKGAQSFDAHHTRTNYIEIGSTGVFSLSVLLFAAHSILFPHVPVAHHAMRIANTNDIDIIIEHTS